MSSTYFTETTSHLETDHPTYIFIYADVKHTCRSSCGTKEDYLRRQWKDLSQDCISSTTNRIRQLPCSIYGFFSKQNKTAVSHAMCFLIGDRSMSSSLSASQLHTVNMRDPLNRVLGENSVYISTHTHTHSFLPASREMNQHLSTLYASLATSFMNKLDL